MKQPVRFLAALMGTALGASFVGAVPASAQNRYGAPPYRQPKGQNPAQVPGRTGPYLPSYPESLFPPRPQTGTGGITQTPNGRSPYRSGGYQYGRSPSYFPYNGTYGYGGTGYYSPGYFGYGGSPYYGGFNYGGYGYSGVTPGYGYGYGNAPTIVQREYVIIREGAQNPPDGQNAPSGQDNRPEGRSGDDFYLGGGRAGSPDRAANESISTALDDLRKAWLNGDYERLRSRFAADGKVRIYLKGQYRYSVESKEFTSVLRDAMTRIDTVAFEFDRPKSEAAGHVFVSGKHTFLDADKNRQETYVSYGLERVNGRWLVTEAGSSGEPISRHEDGPPAGDAGRTTPDPKPSPGSGPGLK